MRVDILQAPTSERVNSHLSVECESCRGDDDIEIIIVLQIHRVHVFVVEVHFCRERFIAVVVILLNFSKVFCLFFYKKLTDPFAQSQPRVVRWLRPGPTAKDVPDSISDWLAYDGYSEGKVTPHHEAAGSS